MDPGVRFQLSEWGVGSGQQLAGQRREGGLSGCARPECDRRRLGSGLVAGPQTGLAPQGWLPLRSGVSPGLSGVGLQHQEIQFKKVL